MRQIIDQTLILQFPLLFLVRRYKTTTVSLTDIDTKNIIYLAEGRKPQRSTLVPQKISLPKKRIFPSAVHKHEYVKR